MDEFLDPSKAGGLASYGEVINNGGDIAYRPAVGYSGTDTFTYTVQDSGGLSGAGTVAVYVVGVDAGANQAIGLPNNRAFLDAVVEGTPAGATIGWGVLDRPLGATVEFDPYSIESPDTVAEFSLPGTYIVQLEVGWQGQSVKDLAAITVQASEKAGNRPPQVQVSAEPNEITLPDNTATLNWVISDDGVSKGGLSQWWEVVDSPIAVDVSFGAYSAKSRTVPVSFSADGVYVLRLTVSDGIDQTTAAILIRVNPDGQANTPPVVDAGPNRQASLIAGPQSITLNDPNVIAMDPDGGPQPLSIQWTILNDTSDIGFTSASDILYPTLTVTKPGQYVVQLAAGDGAATVTDTMAISTSSVMVDAGPDAVVILPEGDGKEVVHALSGWCESQPAGLYSSTEWQVIVQPDPNNVQFDPNLPAVSVWDPNVTFTTAGDYVFRLIAKDSQGTEVDSDEVYIKVKLASQEFTTYLYLYDLDEAGKSEWENDSGIRPCPPANLVFSSYEDGTKIAYQKVDPNDPTVRLYDANPTVEDANIVCISDAQPMLKGQYSYVNGEDGVYKVTSTNKKFSVLAGDVIRDPVSGYFVMSKNGLGVDTEFYSHIARKAWNGRRLVIFSYQDNTHIIIKWDSDNDGVCDSSDPNLVMQKYDFQTETYTDVVMDNYILNKGDHVYRIPGDNDIYIHVLADKPVSVEQCNDSGFYVPSSDGQWTGQDFNVFVDSIADNYVVSFLIGTTPLSVIVYEDNTEVSIRKSALEGPQSLLWSGVLHAGEYFNLPSQQLLSEMKDVNPVSSNPNFNVLEDDIEEKSYLTVHSTKPVSVAVRPDFDRRSYAHGDFVPDRGGTGAGIDLIGYCVPAMEWDLNDEYEEVYTSLQRYFTILAHNDNTQFSIYDPVTWDPVTLDLNLPDPNVISLNGGQYFKAHDDLPNEDKAWRVVSTKPVSLSTGAQRAFAEYAPLAGIQPPTPMIAMTASTQSDDTDKYGNPTVYPQNPAADEVTYTGACVCCWHISSSWAPSCSAACRRRRFSTARYPRLRGAVETL